MTIPIKNKDETLRGIMKPQILILISIVMLTACEKEHIATKGHFTNLEPSQNSRVPASISKKSKFFKKFSQFQDTKQVYIHCKLNSKNADFCYQNQLKKVLTTFTSSHKNIDPQSLKDIKEYHRVDYIKEKMQQIDRRLVRTLNEKIMAAVSLRSNFCKKNAKKKVQKCLNRFIKKDTFNIINEYQRKSDQKLNGVEYLHLKNLAHKRLTNQLLLESIKIKRIQRSKRKTI